MGQGAAWAGVQGPETQEAVTEKVGSHQTKGKTKQNESGELGEEGVMTCGKGEEEKCVLAPFCPHHRLKPAPSALLDRRKSSLTAHGQLHRDFCPSPTPFP